MRAPLVMDAGALLDAEQTTTSAASGGVDSRLQAERAYGAAEHIFLSMEDAGLFKSFAQGCRLRGPPIAEEALATAIRAVISHNPNLQVSRSPGDISPGRDSSNPAAELQFRRIPMDLLELPLERREPNADETLESVLQSMANTTFPHDNPLRPMFYVVALQGAEQLEIAAHFSHSIADGTTARQSRYSSHSCWPR